MMLVWRLCAWRLSVTFIGPNSRTERPRKTKIGTEVGHITHDSDITFKVKRSKVNLQGWGYFVAASRTAYYYIRWGTRTKLLWFPEEQTAWTKIGIISSSWRYQGNHSALPHRLRQVISNMFTKFKGKTSRCSVCNQHRRCKQLTDDLVFARPGRQPSLRLRPRYGMV